MLTAKHVLFRQLYKYRDEMNFLFWQQFVPYMLDM